MVMKQWARRLGRHVSQHLPVFTQAQFLHLPVLLHFQQFTITVSSSLLGQLMCILVYIKSTLHNVA